MFICALNQLLVAAVRFKNKQPALTVYYVILRKQYTKVKTGLGCSYNSVNATIGGVNANWDNIYKSQYIGIAQSFNLTFYNILKNKINFDIFVTPTYLININKNGNNKNRESLYSKDLLFLNTQLGISYNF